MCASPLSFLRAGPPPPRALLLPDALFFTRAVPITAGATAAEAGTQIELALEAVSPFPLAQLYYGWFWVPGAEHALVYAAYRRRFTTDQTASWSEAELVIPESAALLGASVQPATTVLLSKPEGITAIHWETAKIPSRVTFFPVNPEATDEERAKVREEIVRGLGGSRAVIDLVTLPLADAPQNDGEIVFRAGELVSRLTTQTTTALDVRDKGDLAGLRAARKRDVLMWRVVVGCAAALVLLLAGEFALVGGQAWQKVRVTERNARAPAVDKIKQAQDLAVSIQDLMTKRFLPLEMVTAVLGTNADRKPADILITRIQSNTANTPNGANTIILEITTTNPAQVPVYRAELQKMPECENVVVDVLPSSGDRSQFRVTVTFKPGVLKPQPA